MLIVFIRPGAVRTIRADARHRTVTAEGEDLFGWFRPGRPFGQAVRVDRWQAIYVFHDELVSSQPLSNLEWIWERD